MQCSLSRRTTLRHCKLGLDRRSLRCKDLRGIQGSSPVFCCLLYFTLVTNLSLQTSRIRFDAAAPHSTTSAAPQAFPSLHVVIVIIPETRCRADRLLDNKQRQFVIVSESVRACQTHTSPPPLSLLACKNSYRSNSSQGSGLHKRLQGKQAGRWHYSLRSSHRTMCRELFTHRQRVA